MTVVTHLSHATLLIKCGEHYLLTDPWFETPAFGSWVPNPPSFINPLYLAANTYNDKTAILISHDHGDHFDLGWISRCSKKTPIIYPKYSNNTIGNKLIALGFRNLKELEIDTTEENQSIRKTIFQDKSTFIEAECFFNPAISLTDCMIGLKLKDESTSTYLLHGNDCCHPIPKRLRERITNHSEGASKKVACFQTNVASCHPLAYPQTKDVKQVLENRVRYMLKSALKNKELLRFDSLIPYAGYSSAVVKGEDYLDKGFSPYPENLKALLESEKDIKELGKTESIK